MKKAKVSMQIWLILVGAIILLGTGIFISTQYKIEITNLRNELETEFKNNSKIQYSYITKNGEDKNIRIYDFEIEESDYLLKDILNDIHGENWTKNHQTFGKSLTVIGIVAFIIFLIMFIRAIAEKEFVSLLRSPCIGGIIGLLICWLGITMMGTSEAAAQRSMRNHDGDPRFHGAIFLICGIAIVCYAIYVLCNRISRYMLAKNSPDEYEKLVESERTQALLRAQAHQNMLDAERDAAINGTSGAPWETHYLPHPCPYCHRYKVRYIKWEDKRASIYFWGRMSTKIGTNYICDNCKKTWE